MEFKLIYLSELRLKPLSNMSQVHLQSVSIELCSCSSAAHTDPDPSEKCTAKKTIILNIFVTHKNKTVHVFKG